VWTVKSAGVLDDCALPCHWHGQQQRIQARIVKALADEAAGGEYEARLSAGEIGQTSECVAAPTRRYVSVERNELGNLRAEALDETRQMLAALGQDDRRPGAAPGARRRRRR
jgi:hypothetical protein